MDKTFEVRDRRAKERFYLDDLYLNGYAKKCGIYATGVYVSLCRHSNLEQKCWPSIRKIAEELDISQTQTRRAIKILEDHKIITKERLGKKLTNRYWLLNKSEWSDGTLTDSPDRTLNTSPQDTHPLPDRTLHSKDTHSKDTQVRKEEDTSVPSTDKLIPEIINLFKEINPSYGEWFNRKPQREACRWLLTEFGFEQAKEMIFALPKLNALPYAPIATSPYELKNKYARIKAFAEQERSKKKIITRQTPNFIL